MKKDFLLEVGCENIPSSYLDDLLYQLRKNVEESLRADRIECDGVFVLGTPKRLVVHIKGLSPLQRAMEENIIGPPAKVAITSDGVFTKAAQGFAKSHGVPVESLIRVNTDRGEYLAVVKKGEARSSESLLRERVCDWIYSLRSPKMMRWDSSGTMFARPIRWILCLYGKEAIEVQVAGLRSDRLTRLSPLFDATISVETPEDYFALMMREGILLDPESRRQAIRSKAHELALDAGGVLVEDEDLVAEVANLLENPVGLSGSFDDSFLSLPREVVVTALRSHQRYFAVSKDDGELLPRFIAFADGIKCSSTAIARGYERVLRARLDDAVFYYKEDIAEPFERMADRLAGIIWLEGLGTLAEKAERIRSLALWMRFACGIAERGIDEKISRAAILAKADLASEMVKDGKEFTSLQGYIGREYARVWGEEQEVAEAIFEHYLPRFAGDSLPRSNTGALISLADKMDTVSGCILAGLAPSGSQDPYGLRRQAMGVLRIVLERGISFSIPMAVDRSLEPFEKLKGVRASEDIRNSIMELYAQRLYTILRAQEIDHDLIMAVLGAPWEYPGTVVMMAQRLQEMRNREELLPFSFALKRIANIIPKSHRSGFRRERGEKALELLANKAYRELGVDSTLLTLEAERNLCGKVSEACSELLELRRSRRSERAIKVLEALVPHINRYFDEVLVNCEEKSIRDNRISFLSSTYDAFSLFLDSSAVAGE